MKASHFVLSNDVLIPKIGFGTAPLKGDEAYQAVKTALKEGYRHIDTAQIYGNETEVGKAIHDSAVPRKDIFITSKLDASIKNYDEALTAFEGTLKRLNTDYLDLYLIHAPWPWDEKYENYDQGNIEAYKALLRLYEQKKVKAIGVSNFDVRDLENLKTQNMVPMVNQIKYHIGHPQKAVVKYCQENNILIEAYSPLGRAKVLKHPQLVQLASQNRVSVAQLCIRYILEKAILPIPRSSTPKHIANNKSIDFALSKETIETLDQLSIESIEFGTPIKK